MALAIDACAAQHQGDRKEQQDRVLITAHPTKKGVLLAALADGMGGHTGGALAAGSPSGPAVKAILLPSGDQTGPSPTPCLRWVNWTASPPSQGRRKICSFSVRLDLKAIFFPSGDHSGELLDCSPKVNWRF